MRKWERHVGKGLYSLRDNKVQGEGGREMSEDFGFSSGSYGKT